MKFGIISWTQFPNLDKNVKDNFVDVQVFGHLPKLQKLFLFMSPFVFTKLL